MPRAPERVHRMPHAIRNLSQRPSMIPRAAQHSTAGRAWQRARGGAAAAATRCARPQPTQRRRARSTAAALPHEDVAFPSRVPVDSEDLLQQLTLLRRQLDTAVAEEDYAQAQALKQQADALRQQLPPVQQYMQHQLDQLRSGGLQEQQAAIQALGEVGDEFCIPGLAACLHEAALHEAAEAALWSVFHRHPDPAVMQLMSQGNGLLQGAGAVGAGARYASALELFDQACRLAPSYAEAHNKRATLLYLMRRFADSIEVCKLVLELNPHHFGAASGMGMCYMGLEDYASALTAFESALAINPRMEAVRRYAAALKAAQQQQQQQQQKSRGEGDCEGADEGSG